MTCPDPDWTLKLNTGEKNPDLGTGYVQFAMEGLRHQLSQGAANWTIDPGDRFTFYRLVDSVLPSTLGKDGHENSFFDGIDTTWPNWQLDSERMRRSFPTSEPNWPRLLSSLLRPQQMRKETTPRPRPRL